MRLAPVFILLASCAASAPPIHTRPSASSSAKQAATSGDRATFATCPATPTSGMVCIPGGSFLRGEARDSSASPQERVTVSTFLMDTHEVSQRGWGECVEAGACPAARRFMGYMSADQPAVAMRWEDAVAYCAWRGGRLPTEAEWERAASGPDDTRFPWGDARGRGCDQAIVHTEAGHGCGRGTTWPVGSRPAFGYGLHDMAGNVWEWVQDAYTPCYRGCARECGDACSGLDPRGPCAGAAECPEARGMRVVRGGSWWHELRRASVTERRGVPAANPNPHRFGFRCARSVE